MSHSSRDIVVNAWKAFASHDADQIAAVFTPDAEWLAPPGNATAVALEDPSHIVGREAIVRFLAEDFPRFFVSDVNVTFHGLYADGEIRFSVSAGLRGSARRVPRSVHRRGSPQATMALCVGYGYWASTRARPAGSASCSTPTR